LGGEFGKLSKLREGIKHKYAEIIKKKKGKRKE